MGFSVGIDGTKVSLSEIVWAEQFLWCNIASYNALDIECPVGDREHNIVLSQLYLLLWSINLI